MNSARRLAVAAMAASTSILMGAGAARASDMVYTPTNPSFGGNPFNSSHLLGVANAINKYKDPTASNSSDPAAQFLRTLQSRLLSSLASQITDVIFGENAQDSGLIKFGDQEISFVRGADSVTLTISDLASGSVSEIIVPLLQGAS
ncbi:curli assembly protein CsgF [Rhizorhapis sp.]|uniref:curli assembly protein CsgF n=1 Tax=Rhizorhapis sp. TaxID=1968842 RepID=UPI002B4A9F34|nr:curli assembly protein CsgF [Rhizorhapis sp.]HKR17186.1 curli assembly protein CsgF [Rhizorhapis sp.]